MNTHDKIELPEHDCLYETTNEDGFIDVEPAYRKSTVLRLIEADRKRRGEPVAWESTTPTYRKYVTDSTYQRFSDKSKRWYKPYRCASCDGAQTAAPAQEPSDDIDIQDVREYLDAWGCLAHPGVVALLAQYGHPEEPEGWQLVPKEPTQEMFYTCEHIFDHGNSGESPFEFFDRKYKDILEAAPKFGEEE